MSAVYLIDLFLLKKAKTAFCALPGFLGGLKQEKNAAAKSVALEPESDAAKGL